MVQAKALIRELMTINENLEKALADREQKLMIVSNELSDLKQSLVTMQAENEKQKALSDSLKMSVDELQIFYDQTRIEANLAWVLAGIGGTCAIVQLIVQ